MCLAIFLIVKTNGVVDPLVLFSPLAIDIYLPALPLIASTFQVDNALAQDTITWFLFAMGVGQLFAGPLADKLGRRTVALGGITIYAMSALLAWSAQNIEWMLMSRLLRLRCLCDIGSSLCNSSRYFRPREKRQDDQLP